MQPDKKKLKRDYQQNTRPMGVFLIRNNINDKVFLGVSLNLDGIINRHKFQLKNGIHANKALQADWQKFGSGNFAFEIVDELTPSQDASRDYGQELALLAKLWLEKVQPFAERGYNERKQTRSEMLRRIAERRPK
jgi:hypothetical protein